MSRMKSVAYLDDREDRGIELAYLAIVIDYRIALIVLHDIHLVMIAGY